MTTPFLGRSSRICGAMLGMFVAALSLAPASSASAHPLEGKIVEYTVSYSRVSDQDGRSTCNSKNSLRFRGGKVYFSNLYLECGGQIVTTSSTEYGGVSTVNVKSTSTKRCQQKSSSSDVVCEGGMRSSGLAGVSTMTQKETITLDFRVAADGTIQMLDSAVTISDVITTDGRRLNMLFDTSGRLTIKMAKGGCKVTEFTYDTRGYIPAKQRLKKSVSCTVS